MLSELLVPSLLIVGAYFIFVRPNAGQPQTQGGPPADHTGQQGKAQRLGFLDNNNLTRQQYKDALDDRTTGVPNRYY